MSASSLKEANEMIGGFIGSDEIVGAAATGMDIDYFDSPVKDDGQYDIPKVESSLFESGYVSVSENYL